MKSTLFTARSIPRRTILKSGAGALAGAAFSPSLLFGEMRPANSLGYVVGQAEVEGIGSKILANGGNAFDALVATALAGAVTNPHQTGIGGYGAFGIFAYDNGRKVIALDANSTAPVSIRDDTFKLDARGNVQGGANNHGWLASGVPGLIAGMHLIVEKFGTCSFSEVLQPAIQLLRDGFPFPAGPLAANARQMMKDPGTRKLYFPDGKPLANKAISTNPDLAALLETLAKANSVEPFYRGDIAQRIAEAFEKNGGLVTAKDLAEYKPLLVEPISLKWDDRTIHTCPLTCGGLTTLQMLLLMRSLELDKVTDSMRRSQMQIEAMRLAWRDRLTLLGDPKFVDVPQAKLLSDDYSRECAEAIKAAVGKGALISHAISPKPQGGTLSFSAVDKHGNFAALTLTHGNSYGAQVTVDGLGLTLGHGMSRFDPRPGHPNAPAPGKKPLINMVPMLISRNGQAILAAGGRGGQRIPNSMLSFLDQSITHGQSLNVSMNAARLHTTGDTKVECDAPWLKTEEASLKAIGYRTSTSRAAVLSAVAIEDGMMRAAMR